MNSAACFVAGGIAPGAALQALLEKEALSLASIDLVCCEQQQAQPSQSREAKYNVVLAASSSALSRDLLVRVARSMAPGGRLYVYEASQPASSAFGAGSGAADASQRVETLRRDLLLCGFTDAQVLDATGLSSSAAAVPSAWVFAQLPAWGLGASSKLSLKRPAAAPAATAPAPVPAPPAPPATSGAAAGVWKLAASGTGAGEDEEDEDELVDEDLLLTAEDKRAVTAPNPDDCEVGQTGRKACKNCSCGRAEMEAAGVKVAAADMDDNLQSACGSCYLGDAFRCGTCPYRGLPAFQPGEKVTLGAGLLVADV